MQLDEIANATKDAKLLVLATDPDREARTGHRRGLSIRLRVLLITAGGRVGSAKPHLLRSSWSTPAIFVFPGRAISASHLGSLQGEAISWHVVEELRGRGHLPKGISVQRVVFTEVTQKAVQAALANPRKVWIRGCPRGYVKHCGTPRGAERRDGCLRRHYAQALHAAAAVPSCHC